jgi:DNA-binding transcriptional LysR family regulator
MRKRPRPDLNDMSIFASVVEHGNYSRAAKALGLERSNICRRMNDLEQALSAKLFQVNRRHFVLTEFGSQFYQHCAQMMAGARAALALTETVRKLSRNPFISTRVDENTLPATVGEVRRIVREELARLTVGEIYASSSLSDDTTRPRST